MFHSLMLNFLMLRCLLLHYIIIIIKTYIWDPLITNWFFSLQLKSKNENAKSIYIYYLHKKAIIKSITTKGN